MWSARRLVLAVFACWLAVAMFATTASRAAGERDASDLLPNLRTLPLTDIQIRISATGKKRLRFSTSIGNHGTGVLELMPKREDCDHDGDFSNDRTAYQEIYADTNGNGAFDRGTDHAEPPFTVGCMVFHPAHDHWHFQDFARYQLFRGSSSGALVAEARKVSFCVLDDTHPWQGVPGSPAAPFYTGCSRHSTMGISAGWADVYLQFLQGQALDVTGLPTGRYCLVATADPDARIREADDADNAVTDRVRIRARSVVDTGIAC
jgi:hypothetical protein